MPWITRPLFLTVLLLVAVGPLQAADDRRAADPLDWPNWRGPEQNGVSREKNLIDKWIPEGGPGSNLIWKSEELGGRSTPIVLRGKLYTTVQADPGTEKEGEKVVCVDAATGKKLWENRFNVYLSDVPDSRVGWANCTGDPETGRIYVQGVSGYFACLDGDTGKTIWSRSLHEEYGFLSTYGGRTHSPIVFEDLVIASAVVINWGDMARPAHRFMAFNKNTGEMVWFNGTRTSPPDTTYSVAVVTTLSGQAAMVFGSSDGGVWAIQPRTGKHLWHYDFSLRGVNTSPLVVGDIVYACHGEETMKGDVMGAVAALDGSAAGAGKAIWEEQEIVNGKSSPLLVDDRLYVIDERAKLLIFDPKTGEQLSKTALSSRQFSNMLYADGKIYTCSEDGVWHALQPTDNNKVKVLQKLRLTDSEGKAAESLGSPIVSHGRIYLPLMHALYCIGDPNQKPTADPLPKPAPELPAANDPKPAQVQVVPCDVLLKPGQKQKLTVRLFNSRGVLLKESPAEFSVEGPGSVDAGGTYTAAEGSGHVAATVKVKVGDLSGQARIRIVPPLPWKFDFNEADDMPITWIQGRVRYVIRDVNGEKIAVKRNQIPTGPNTFTKLGTRSQLWMGPIDLSNYTVQADVQGTLGESGKMPDFGIINQRYTLELQGQYQRLSLSTWIAQSRMVHNVDYAWKPGVWYTLKLTTSLTADGLVRVRGKVWPRGEKEPEKWMIDAVDPSPNLQGSPGLFGNAQEAEIYVDNILITPNGADGK